MPGSMTPAISDEPSITINAGYWNTKNSSWLHGILSVEKEDVELNPRQWENKLFITAVTEQGCQPTTENICHRHIFTEAPLWIEGYNGLIHLPFNIELNQTLPYPLQNEPVWLYVTAGELTSNPLRLMNEKQTKQSLFVAPVDNLILAYAQYKEGEFILSTQSFIKAFEYDAIRLNIDSDHLFNAACAAGKAFEMDKELDNMVDLAVKWIEEDILLRVKRKSIINMKLSNPQTNKDTLYLLTQELNSHSLHFEIIKTDVDLKEIRCLQQYKELFKCH